MQQKPEAEHSRLVLFIHSRLGAFSGRSCIQLKFPACVPRAIAFIHTHIVLWSFPHFYSSNIKEIANEINTRSDETHRWESFAGGIRRLCYAALTKGFLVISGGAYISQNSYEIASSASGVVLVIVGIFVLLNTYVTLTYLDSINSCSYTHLFSNELVVEQAARILAIPVASIIWSLIIFSASLVLYFGQTGAPQIDLGQDFDQPPSIRSLGTYAHNEDAQYSPSSEQPGITTPRLPLLAKLAIGLMVSVFALYFLSLLRDVRRSRNALMGVASRDIEAVVTTPTSDNSSS